MKLDNSYEDFILSLGIALTSCVTFVSVGKVLSENYFVYLIGVITIALLLLATLDWYRNRRTYGSENENKDRIQKEALKIIKNKKNFIRSHNEISGNRPYTYHGYPLWKRKEKNPTSHQNTALLQVTDSLQKRAMLNNKKLRNRFSLEEVNAVNTGKDLLTKEDLKDLKDSKGQKQTVSALVIPKGYSVHQITAV